MTTAPSQPITGFVYVGRADSFVDLLAGEANIGGGWLRWRMFPTGTFASALCHFALRPCRVVIRRRRGRILAQNNSVGGCAGIHRGCRGE